MYVEGSNCMCRYIIGMLRSSLNLLWTIDFDRFIPLELRKKIKVFSFVWMYKLQFACVGTS
jgi:hypothetical protein